VSVTVLDRRDAPAQEASGNPAGLFHGTVNGDDSSYARLFRAAALQAARSYREAIEHDPQIGALNGLLRLDLGDGGRAALQATLDRQGLPAAWVQALDAVAASACAQVPLGAPAWLYPEGGWLAPARWVRHVLAQAGVRFQGDAAAARISFENGLWTVWDAEEQPLATAPVLVLACTASTPQLLQPWTAEPWPLDATRGQVTRCASDGHATPLRCAVAGDGYAIPLHDGSLLCGATRETATLAEMQAAPDIGADISAAAHRHNLERLQRLTGLQPPAVTATLQGRSGWRLHSDDRLPIAGAVPLRDLPPGQRRDQARLLPRVEGLFVLTALGSRGLTLAPLLGRLVAAQATGTPWPLEQDLADAVDPARWRVRAARREQSENQAGA
jgi:tRNA 5-methylaminomethyl-2-thiouridine biosynthesis bifunctional protein